MHQWSTTPLNNQTADSRAQWQEGQPASSLNNSARGLMTTAAFWRDDNLGTLTATLGANNVYTVTTGQGLIDPASIQGGGTAKITHPFSIVATFLSDLVGTSTNIPQIIIDGAPAAVLVRHDGNNLQDYDIQAGRLYHLYGDFLGSYPSINRVRVMTITPSYIRGTSPPTDVAAIYAQIESRGQAYSAAAVSSSVTSGRWVYVGDKSCFSQPGTGGFISPFGAHTMHCDYWTYQFLDANGIVQCAPFAFRFRAFQIYIANQGWVTCGAAS